MTTLLASFPSPPQGVWHLGWLPIRAYAVFIIVGIIVALIIGDRRWAARGGEPGVIYDIALWAVPFGLVGGRLYHVITDWQKYFGENGAGFVAALKIWDGGLGIWGAVALGGVGAWLGCRQRGIPLPAFGDAIAPGIILAQAIGRLGNYFNQELYGRPTTMPWGMKVYERRDPSGVIDVHSLDGVSTGHVHAIVQPTFLYELLWNVLVFVALIYLDRWFKLGHGRLFAAYVAGYCIGRFWVELLRDDPATHIAGIRINSFTSTFVFIGAVVYILLAPKGREEPPTLAGKPRTPKEKVPQKEKVEAKEPKEPATAEDSALVEWTKELAAVASTSGVVAGVAVAAKDDEDESSRESDEASAEELTPDIGSEDADVAPEPPEDEASEAEATDEEPAPEAVSEDSVEEGETDESVEPEVAEAAASEAEAESDEGAEPEEAESEESDTAESADEPVEPEAPEDEAPDVEAEPDESVEPVVAEAVEEADVEIQTPDGETPTEELSEDSVEEAEPEQAEPEEADAVESVDESVDDETPEDTDAEQSSVDGSDDTVADSAEASEAVRTSATSEQASAPQRRWSRPWFGRKG